jgi:IclR family acetate operon transcriptional repressor
VRSVRIALEVVESIARDQPVALTEIAAGLALPVTTVHRALGTLAEAGWVRQVMPGRRWVLSSHLEQLVGRGLAMTADRARPALADLRTRSGESSMYAVVDGDHMVVVVAVDSTQALRVVGSEGTRQPLHLLSTGKAVLASWPLADICAYAVRAGLDPDAVVADCAATVATGYAVNLGGWEVGVGSISVAVPSAGGMPTSAVGVFGPIERFEGRVESIAELVSDASRTLAADFVFGRDISTARGIS